MKQLICSIRDLKTQAFSQPFFSLAKGQAIRDFGDAINGDPDKSGLARHPEDYQLFVLGTFDPGSGEIAPAFESVLGGLEVLSREIPPIR